MTRKLQTPLQSLTRTWADRPGGIAASPRADTSPGRRPGSAHASPSSTGGLEEERGGGHPVGLRSFGADKEDEMWASRFCHEEPSYRGWARESVPKYLEFHL